MLAGRYPSDQFGDLRPRINWDRTEGTLKARAGARMLAVVSGGTIPDRGLYGVFTPEGSRVGELDEEFVYESRPGETMVLGASTWRIEDITRDRVVVTPAPGEPGKMPFWHGDGVGRPGRAGPGHRRLPPRRRLVDRRAAGRGVLARPPGRRQPAVIPGRGAGGHRRRPAHRPPGRRRALPRRAGRLAGVRALPVRRQGARPVGARHRVTGTGQARPRGPDHLERRGHRRPPARGRRGAAARHGAGRPRRGRGAGRRRAGQLGAVRVPVPGERGPGPAPAPAPARLPHAALADAPAGVRPAGGGVQARRVPHPAGDLPGVPARRLRPPRPRRPAHRHPGPHHQGGVGRDRRARRRSPPRWPSPTWPTSSTTATPPWPSAGPRPSPSTGRCWPSCWAPRSCGSSSTPPRWPPWRTTCRPSTSGAGRATPTRPATTCGAWATSPEASCGPGPPPTSPTTLVRDRRAIEIRVAGEARLIAAEDAGRYRDALGVQPPPGLPDAFLETTVDPLGTLLGRWARTHGPFTSDEPALRFGLPVARRRLAPRGQGRAGRAAARRVPARRPRAGVVRPRGPPLAAAAVAGRPAPGGRARRRPGAGPVPAGVAGGRVRGPGRRPAVRGRPPAPRRAHPGVGARARRAGGPGRRLVAPPPRRPGRRRRGGVGRRRPARPRRRQGAARTCGAGPPPCGRCRERQRSAPDGAGARPHPGDPRPARGLLLPRPVGHRRQGRPRRPVGPGVGGRGHQRLLRRPAGLRGGRRRVAPGDEQGRPGGPGPARSPCSGRPRARAGGRWWRPSCRWATSRPPSGPTPWPPPSSTAMAC